VETAQIKSEFEIGKAYSRESFHLSNGFYACLLLCIGSMFIKTKDVRFILMMIFGVLGLGLLIARYLLLLRSDKLVVEDDKLRHARGELRPDEIDTILLADFTLTVKRKKRRWSHVRFTLKHLHEYEALKDRIAAFAGRHGIKIEIAE